MPYVDSEARKRLAFADNQCPETAGDLTYLIYRLAKRYLKFKKKCFLTMCVIMGCFICAALEFYRREAAPYEDLKIKENGDV